MMTGTGIVPMDFYFAEGDQVRSSIEGIGVLEQCGGREFNSN